MSTQTPEEYLQTVVPISLSQLAPGSRIHFIGVCGVGMGQLAVALSERGFLVTGSDAEFSEPVATVLRGSAVQVTNGFSPERLEPRPQLTVVGAAVGRANAQLRRAAELGLPYTTVAHLVRELCIGSKRACVVCGTHGKSTTTAMLAHILSCTGQEPSFFFGGMRAPSGQTSCLGLYIGAGPWSVIEGDEYRDLALRDEPKLLHYPPTVVVLNSVEFDHGDLYPDLDALLAMFGTVLARIPEHGTALLNGDCAALSCALAQWRRTMRCRIATFGAGEQADYRLIDRQMQGGLQQITLRGPGDEEVTGRLPVIGEFNARNAVAALGAAHVIGAPLPAALAALANYRPVLLRQQVVFDSPGVTVLEDFAHHPTAVQEVVTALREIYPGRELRVVFHFSTPTSRWSVFHDRYLSAFSGARKVILVRPTIGLVDRGHEPLDLELLSSDLVRRGVPTVVVDERAASQAVLEPEAPDGVVVLNCTRQSHGAVLRGILERLTNDEVRTR